MQVFRDIKFLISALGICEWDGVFFAPLVRFDQHHQFAENFAEVAPVYFVNDEHVRLLG